MADMLELQRGREMAPIAFIVAATALTVLVQGLRILGARALPLVRGATALLVFLVTWEASVAAGLVTTTMLPPPTLTLTKLHGLWLNGYLGWHVFASLQRFLLSFVLAVAAGVTLGVLVASFPALSRLLSPVFDFMRMIPAPAWLPFAILWLGLGDPPAIFIVWVGIFFPILLNTIRGVRDAQPIHVEVIRTLGGRRRDEILLAVLPAALPVVFTGIRTGFGIGWVVLSAAELTAVDSGLGWLIQTSQWIVDIPTIIAAMTLICWLGLLLDISLRELERRLVRPSEAAVRSVKSKAIDSPPGSSVHR
jgi:ABC-type nitrate/sulfonate/bicarbonate transport system permease component